MVAILVVQNGNSKPSFEAFSNSMSEYSAHDWFVFSENASATNALQKMTVVSPADNSLNSAVDIVFKSCSADTVLIVDSNMGMIPAQLNKLIESSIKVCDQSSLAFAAIESTSGLIDIQDLSVEFLASQFRPQVLWPSAFIQVNRKLCTELTKLSEGNFENSSELLAYLTVKASADSENIEQLGTIVGLENAQTSCVISNQANSRRLKQLIAACNIEDIFPQHDWKRHQEESAAASYHTLAAQFIKLGELNSAVECLAIGDKLEDSPRSLALKGLIAVARGEVLAAVANMVSSLQGYELRKKSSDAHYLSFKPKDLEVINQKLHRGLKALNVRNNEAALLNFADAVFNFDSFFEQQGISALKVAAQ